MSDPRIFWATVPLKIVYDPETEIIWDEWCEHINERLKNIEIYEFKEEEQMSNRKVWFTGVSLMEKELGLMFFDIQEHEMTEERYNQFRWDRLIRVYIPQSKQLLYYSDDKKNLEAFWLGYELANEVSDLDVFEENCEKMHKRVLENEAIRRGINDLHN